jgi:L-aspartate oxidase
MNAARQALVVRTVTSDVLIVGAGVAGLSCALGLAGRRVSVLTKRPLGEGGNSPWAQGGIAAAVGRDDSPALHAQDTIEAGAGLCAGDVVRALTSDAPGHVRRLQALGTRFDTTAAGDLALGREAAHSRSRILHARGDASGAEIVRALVAAVVRSPWVEIAAGSMVEDLIATDGEVAGVLALDAHGARTAYLAPAVVLATGGIGRVYLHTTNPPEATGDGLAIAARAGAVLADVEFVQFHPTALDADADPRPLLTEALRGAGALLIDERGERFVLRAHADGELAPRDVVARAIWAHQAAGHRVLLDARRAVGDAFPSRFPTVFEACMRHGLDPRVTPMPVTPAAHYHMGGVATDASGRTSLPGLWACGEVASTGVHGANRLASNSLLEALVFGARAADDIAARAPECRALAHATVRHLRARLSGALPNPAEAPSVPEFTGVDVGTQDSQLRTTPDSSQHTRILALEHRIRTLMWNRVGLVRTEEGLDEAAQALDAIGRAGPEGESGNLLLVAQAITTAARERRESRGGHYRADYPVPSPACSHRSFIRRLEDGRFVAASWPAALPAMAGDAGDARGVA